MTRSTKARVLHKLGWVPLVFVLTAGKAFAGDVDIVHLKNGGRVQGTVMEDDPVNGATVKLADGSIRKIPRVGIASIDYANAETATPTAPPNYLPSQNLPQPATQPISPPTAPAPAYGGQTSAGFATYHGQSDDKDEKEETTTLKPLWLTGLIVLCVTYPLTVVITAGISEAAGGHHVGSSIGESAIPIFGPWVLIGDGNNKPSGGQIAALATSGVTQALAAASLIIGLSIHVPKRHHVEDVKLVPSVLGGMSGVNLVGRF